MVITNNEHPYNLYNSKLYFCWGKGDGCPVTIKYIKPYSM